MENKQTIVNYFIKFIYFIVYLFLYNFLFFLLVVTFFEQQKYLHIFSLVFSMVIAIWSTKKRTSAFDGQDKSSFFKMNDLIIVPCLIFMCLIYRAVTFYLPNNYGYASRLLSLTVGYQIFLKGYFQKCQRYPTSLELVDPNFVIKKYGILKKSEIPECSKGDKKSINKKFDFNKRYKVHYVVKDNEVTLHFYYDSFINMVPFFRDGFTYKYDNTGKERNK